MKRLAAVLLVFGTVLCSVALFGQTYLGSINGIVTDATGAVIPKATGHGDESWQGNHVHLRNGGPGGRIRSPEPGAWAIRRDCGGAAF